MRDLILNQDCVSNNSTANSQGIKNILIPKPMHTQTNVPETEMFVSVEGNDDARNAYEKLQQSSI